MDETEIKHVVEAALLAAGRPLTLDRLGDLFAAKGSAPDKATLRRVLEGLANDYSGRGIELKEVASGYRIQVKRSVSDWLQPLWEERAPRYTRALLETLALIAYRQPITRAEIEEVRGVVVSTNIIRTLLERNWVRVVGHRDVPGKPAMFGTTKDFLDYFGLKKLEDLPPLAEIKEIGPELNPQTDLIEVLAEDAPAAEQADASAPEGDAEAAPAAIEELEPAMDVAIGAEGDDDSELEGPDLVVGTEESHDAVVTEPSPNDEAHGQAADGDEATGDEATGDEGVSAEVIPLRSGTRGSE